MNKWRHLLEPLINESIAPIPWDQALKQPYILFESDSSVVVANISNMLNRKALQIWLTAGIMHEVDSLLQQAEKYGRDNGFELISYCGRRGWLKSQGYKEIATVGVKEL